MLLGKADVILNVVPAYVTDALVRKVNVDRYDDREIIATNLIESYEQLMAFARKHLPDKFFLEDDQRKSLRDIIAREMLVNTLIHREMTSSFRAKFVIEKDKMYVENANRAAGEGVITPENLEPNPKNPIIASFFRNIGYSDQLGSGVRNLFKYTKLYSGKEPEFKEGDVFRITVPLNEAYSFDFGQTQLRESIETKTEIIETKTATDETKVAIMAIKFQLNKNEIKVLQLIEEDPSITQKEIQKATNISMATIKRILPKLQEKGILTRTGSKRSGKWLIKAETVRQIDKI